MIKLRVKEPLRNERGEMVGSGNYGSYIAGEVFVLSKEEAERELSVCGHALEPYEVWESRQRLEQAKQAYTRQQAEDFARHQAELRQMSLAETELRKQAAQKRLSVPESRFPTSGLLDLTLFQTEKEELHHRMEEQKKTIAELKAAISLLEQGGSKSGKKKEVLPKPTFSPDEEV